MITINYILFSIITILIILNTIHQISRTKRSTNLSTLKYKDPIYLAILICISGLLISFYQYNIIKAKVTQDTNTQELAQQIKLMLIHGFYYLSLSVLSLASIPFLKKYRFKLFCKEEQ